MLEVTLSSDPGNNIRRVLSSAVSWPLRLMKVRTVSPPRHRVVNARRNVTRTTTTRFTQRSDGYLEDALEKSGVEEPARVRPMRGT